MAELSPMMKQYFEIKKDYGDTILMFRLGDFYEMFYDDAKLVSRELDLVLTGRDCGQEERAPMCGVPFHSAEGYISRLIAKGYKVAVCEQTENPALAKGIVKREVIRIVTPGTVIESDMLDEGKNNFLCVMWAGAAEKLGLCFADVSTGAFHLTEIQGSKLESSAINELGRFMPTEILANPFAVNLKGVSAFIGNRLNALTETVEDDVLSPDEARELFTSQFGEKSTEGVGEEGIAAAAVCLDYLRNVQKTNLSNIHTLDYYGESGYMRLDVSARRSLELTGTMRSGEKKGSLLWVLDRTRTPMGKRLMKSWLEQPLLSVARISERHNAVEELTGDSMLTGSISEALSGISDMERSITRIAYGTANARELRSLSAAIARIPAVKELIAASSSRMLRSVYGRLDLLEDIRDLIDSAIVEDPPFTVREGGMINEGFNSGLDELRSIVSDGKGFLADIQMREQERTGIKKLKVGYNRVFGYYIEVSNSFKELVPDDYVRKQTLANCERYITQELKELESKVLGAQERITQLEYEIFNSVREKTADNLLRIQSTAAAVAELDALTSFASVAVENGYTRPEITDSKEIRITAGRHPVVEKMLSDAPFVPNDTLLDCGDNRCAIITGPNMAGKSTYMRQVALIVIMAQIGSFVPAKSCSMGVVDSVFTRVGASDDLSAGQSTFMVEMNEVAYILKNATASSLIIFDEIGRGTSTYDGMSIAEAVLEYTADRKKLGAKTLFATHYHELTDLEGKIEGVKNYHISVKKRGDSVTFLRRIVRGCADGSYGIEVAKLAGVPENVVRRAKTVLAERESAGQTGASLPVAAGIDTDAQISFAAGQSERLVDELRSIDVNTLTPIEAMSRLFELVNKAQNI